MGYVYAWKYGTTHHKHVQLLPADQKLFKIKWLNFLFDNENVATEEIRYSTKMISISLGITPATPNDT